MPDLLFKNLAKLGVHSLYGWQSSCLLGRGLLQGERNLVYTAPTGGGKSLVADILMLKRVIQESRKAILVLPYVALVQEKLKWLRKIVDGILKSTTAPEEAELALRSRHIRDDGSIRIVGCFGGSKVRFNWQNVDVAICTIEKVWHVFNPSQEGC